MATDRQSIEIISKWVLLVANLCAADNTLTKDKLKAIVEGLAVEFPSGAFTSECARAVTEGSEFFPGYDRFRTRVGIWWSKHRPVQKVLPGHSDASGLTGDDLMWFNFYTQRASENFGAVKMSYGSYPATSRENVLSLVKSQSLPAWAVITGNTSHRISEPTADERAYVTAAAQRAREVMAAAAIPLSASMADQLAAVRASPALASAAKRGLPAGVEEARAKAREIASKGPQ